MKIKVKLDCAEQGTQEYYHHCAALLAASKIYDNYKSTKNSLFGTGPELFAEQWLRGAFTERDPQLEDLIMVYFGKILWEVQHGR